MGETGSIYLIRQDFMAINNSNFPRYDEDHTTLTIKIKPPQAEKALQGKWGDGYSEKNHKGVPVYTWFRPISFFDKQWALVYEINQDEFKQ